MKKFTLHLDAILILSILFCALIGLIVFQQTQVSALTLENKKLQWQGVEDSFNLSSKENYIKELEAKLSTLKEK